MDMHFTKNRIKEALRWEDVFRFYNLPFKDEKKNTYCPFHEDKKPSLSFFGDKQFKCFGCDKNGDIFKFIALKEGLDCVNDFPEVLKIGERIAGTSYLTKGAKKQKIKERKSQPKPSKEDIEKFHNQLLNSPKVTQYFAERGISKETLQRHKVGFGTCKEAGGRTKIVFPNYSLKSRPTYLRYKKWAKEDEFPTFSPEGTELGLYMLQNLHQNDDEVFIVEGEIDALSLDEYGITVVAIPGAQTFKDEWLKYFKDVKEITVCLDNDKVGKKGAEKIITKFQEKYPDKVIWRIELPKELGEKGDVNDFFLSPELHTKSNPIDSFVALRKTPPVNEENRIAKLTLPKKQLLIKDWRGVIIKNFPATLRPSEFCLATVCQLLIKDVKNPFALVIVDVPSSGKTISLDFFAGLPEIVYPTDKFTAASFVSHAANIKKEKLAEIDLLPRIRFKTLIARDMASVFSDKQDVLEESLGILTRVLDGSGLQKDSGVHGGRGYKGNYSFMMLAASTPLRKKIWDVMGNLGARLFFLNLRQPDPSIEDLTEQLTSGSFPEKEQRCLYATNELLKTIWNQYPEGIDWDRRRDKKELLGLIARCATLLARARGVLKDMGKDELEPQTEKPSRLNQLLYNFARGNAIANGRLELKLYDIKQSLVLATESSPPNRSQIIIHLLENSGVSNSTSLEKLLKCSKPTVIKYAEELAKLNVLNKDRDSLNPIDPTRISLKDEFLPLCKLLHHTGGENFNA